MRAAGAQVAAGQQRLQFAEGTDSFFLCLKHTTHYPHRPCAGEFGQDKRLLPAWYHIFPCKAALFNLARSGGLLRW